MTMNSFRLKSHLRRLMAIGLAIRNRLAACARDRPAMITRWHSARSGVLPIVPAQVSRVLLMARVSVFWVTGVVDDQAAAAPKEQRHKRKA
jgi:hypothetical protein